MNNERVGSDLNAGEQRKRKNVYERKYAKNVT